MPHRAVILSGSLGSGHDVICEVVTGSLAGLGWESRTLDCMGMLGRYEGRAGDWVFRRLMGMPGVYDALHFAHLRPGSPLAGAMDRAATARLVPALQDELRREPAELIVAAFATGASAAAKLDGAAPGLRTVALCADVPCTHSAWVRGGTDLFLVTSPPPPPRYTAISPTPGLRRAAAGTPGLLPPPVPGGCPPLARPARGRAVRLAHRQWVGTGPAGGCDTRTGRRGGARAGRGLPQPRSWPPGSRPWPGRRRGCTRSASRSVSSS